MINRDDMLELTRRMTPQRNCFSRVAGAYVDKDGFVDGTFNIHFGKLSAAETKKNLEIAKTVPFARTNEQLKEYAFSDDKKSNLWSLLTAIKQSELKDDSLLEVLYDIVVDNYRAKKDYAVYVYYGAYDVPVKAADKSWLEGSSEEYDFILCVVSPLEGEYEPGKPEFGFLFPAFADRSSDESMVDIFIANPGDVQGALMKVITGSNRCDTSQRIHGSART